MYSMCKIVPISAISLASLILRLIWLVDANLTTHYLFTQGHRMMRLTSPTCFKIPARTCARFQQPIRWPHSYFMMENLDMWYILLAPDWYKSWMILKVTAFWSWDFILSKYLKILRNHVKLNTFMLIWNEGKFSFLFHIFDQYFNNIRHNKLS